MKTLEELKRESLYARKNKDKLRADVLTTMLSDVNRLAKDDQRDPTDDDVTLVAKRFMKNLEKTRDLRTTQKVLDEINVVSDYFPKQLTQPVPIVDLAERFIAENPNETSPQKIMGMIMKEVRGNANPRMVLEQVEELMKK